MTRLKTLPAILFAATIAATGPAMADGHKPACDKLDDATDQTNSACED